MKSNKMIIISSMAALILFFFITSCNRKNKDNSGKLNYGFFMTKEGVQYNGVILKDVDKSTFEIIDEHFCKDKSQVFYHNAYRESRDYFMSKRYQISKLNNGDPATFVSLGYGYGKDKKIAWFESDTFEVADVNSLEAIDHHFARDNNSVYINRLKIENVNGQAFQKIDTYYAKDDRHYFYIFNDQVDISLHPINGDYNTFKMLDYHYSKDDAQVFYLGKKLKGALANSFRIIIYPYSTDEKNIFFRGDIIHGADVNTFQPLSEKENSLGETYYAKDKNKIFRNNLEFKGIDLVTFKVLNEKYTKDKNGVYYIMKKMPEADPHTFEVFPHYMGDADAKDKNHTYGDGLVVESN